MVSPESSSDTALDARSIAIARGRAYDLLADLFLRGPRRLDHLRSVPMLAVHLPQECDDEALAWHHHVTAQQVPPYAGVFLHEAGLLGGSASDEARGAMKAGGFSSVERDIEPDHLAASLQFLAWLSGAEADAWRDGQATIASQIQGRARAYIETQLLRWLPPLVVAVESVDPKLYGSAARLIAELVSDQLGRVPETWPLPVRSRAILDEPKVGLRQIADYLAIPVNAGALLSPDWIRTVARETGTSTGFGSRSMRLEGLLKTAARRGEVAPVLDRLLSAVRKLEQRTLRLPAGAPWAERLAHTREVLARMQTELAKTAEA